jgi:hypothetical protein
VSQPDPYIDPRTGRLRNKLGITDADELDRVEAEDLLGRRQRAAPVPLSAPR